MAWSTFHYYHEGWSFFEDQQHKGLEVILCLWDGIFLQEVKIMW